AGLAVDAAAAALTDPVHRDRGDDGHGAERDAEQAQLFDEERRAERDDHNAQDADSDARRAHGRGYGTRASGACASRRDIAVSMATALSSMPTKRRPSRSATASVVPLPAYGSRTSSPGEESARMSRSRSAS